MPLQCPDCKAINRDTATFCDHCSSRLITSSEKVPLPASLQKPDTLPEEINRSTTTSSPPSPAYLPDVPSRQVSPLAQPPKVRGGLWGIVSHLRGETESVTKNPFSYVTANKTITIHSWMFNLQRTNKKWKPIKDRNGFMLPVLEVKFKSTQLHGPPLEEGSRVIVKGRQKKDTIRAKEIWNTSPGMIQATASAPVSFWGRVANFNARSSQDMRYPDQTRHVEVWSFRLQRTDQGFQEIIREDQGNPLPALPVEIRAQIISGPVQDGDKVEIHGRVIRGTIYTKQVINHSAGGASLVVKEWAGIP